jgi:hypothetical protein
MTFSEHVTSNFGPVADCFLGQVKIKSQLEFEIV